MLIARRRVSRGRLRAVRQQYGGTVQQVQRPVQPWQQPGLSLQGCKQPLAHLLRHFQGQLTTRLAVGACVGRQLGSGLALWPAHELPHRTGQQMPHRRRQRAFGVQPLENHQPDHHPSAQRALARKRPLPLKQARHLPLANRLAIAFKRPRQRRLAAIRRHDAARRTGFLDRTTSDLVHLLTYPISEHFHSYMFFALNTENMPLSGIGHSCLPRRQSCRR